MLSSDSNSIRTHNHLVRNPTPNHSAKLSWIENPVAAT